jgi:hypothetical protein
VLSLIKKTIDPDAFIAGGAAAELYLGTDFGHNSDVDIFFKNPIFDLNPDGLGSYDTLISVLKGNGYSAYRQNLEIYYYHQNIRRIVTSFKEGINFDFIQYSSKMSREDLLNSFDLDECKITLRTSWDDVVVEPSNEFLEAWKTEEINPHYDMFKYEPVNEIQNEKTKERVKKWEERKKQYFNQ